MDVNSPEHEHLILAYTEEHEKLEIDLQNTADTHNKL
jgi:hypothetical protein